MDPTRGLYNHVKKQNIYNIYIYIYKRLKTTILSQCKRFVYLRIIKGGGSNKRQQKVRFSRYFRVRLPPPEKKNIPSVPLDSSAAQDILLFCKVYYKRNCLPRTSNVTEIREFRRSFLVK